MKRLRQAAVTVTLVCGDTVAVVLSYALAYLARSLVLTGTFGTVSEVFPYFFLPERSYFLIVYPLVLAYEGLYTKRLAGWEEAKRCVRGMFYATAAVTVLLFGVRALAVSRVAVVLAFVFGVILVPVLRVLLKRALVKAGLLRQPLVVLGCGAEAEDFITQLNRSRWLGYSVIQRLDPRQDAGFISALLRGTFPAGSALAVVADSLSADELKQALEVAERCFADVLVVPNAALLRSADAELEQVGSVLVMKYRYNLLRPLNTLAKRAWELGVSVVLLVLLSPLLLLLALLVRLGSPGPVLFRQQRIGRGRRLFYCLKFRTMHVDAEKRLEELLAANPQVREEWKTYARITDDPRVTPVGRFLRRFSLDELPQLLNVLAGSMALVGPRPYLPSEAGQIGRYLDTIVRVRPGMTGLWQVSGRSALPFRERLVLDEYYIRNWSLWIDFSILLRTFRAMIGGRGAY